MEVNPQKMEMTALLSKNKIFRYTLTRKWDEGLPQLTFLMMNPSTADHTKNDPTIRKCINIATRHLYGSITVINLFAYRASSPEALLHSGLRVGPENDAEIAKVMRYSSHLVVAWGNILHKHQEVFDRKNEVLGSIYKYWDVKVFTLGTTNAEEPRHPLMLKNSTELIPCKITEIATHIEDKPRFILEQIQKII